MAPIGGFVMSLILLVGSYPLADAAQKGGRHTKQPQQQKKVTSLQFYLHDIVTSKHNATAVLVAKAPRKDGFGTVMVIDDVITEGPSHKSKPLGRGQGMYMECSFGSISFLLTFTAVLDTPGYKGTLSFHGADQIGMPTREISVVGGTGDFRFARGYATIQTNAAKGLNAVLLFTINLTY